MNIEELTWFNQQLAAMLREGLPLEGALRELTQTQRKGALRDEFIRLEQALATGLPLEVAVAAGKLPPLYVRLVQAGARSGDLPGALAMAADYYAELNIVWRRTKSLLLYPVLVIVVGFGLSSILWKLHSVTMDAFRDSLPPGALWSSQVGLLVAPLTFVVVGVLFALVGLIPRCREWVVWRLPGFRESRTASFTGGMALMLRNGCPLPEALGLMATLERGSPAGADIARWQEQLRNGDTDLAARSSEWRALPPLLGWFMRMAGGNLAEGFQRASKFYRERATHRLDLLLHGALPALLIVLGWVVASQIAVFFRLLVPMIDNLGSGE